jgi:nicotinamide mononucleotide transporter
MIEGFGIGTALLGVLFSIKRMWVAWLFNILSAGIYTIVFYQNQLYADMELQALFIVLGIMGLFSWRRSVQDWRAERSSLNSICLGIVFSVIFGIGLGFLHTRILSDASLPYLDGILTGLSSWATWLAIKKKIANWIVWIGVDLMYVGMYAYKEMWGTACLYALFLGLAIKAYQEWSITLKSID